MQPLKLTKLGNSVGVVLPKECLARLGVEAGDLLYITESPDGYRLTPNDPFFERQFSQAETIMKARHSALRALAN